MGEYYSDEEDWEEYVDSFEEYGGEFSDDDGYKQYCGGVVISKKWVLSAAHCFDGYDEDEFQLRFGLLNIYEPDQTRLIDYVKKNPKYNKNNLDHDLALVKLNKPIELNENVIPAILPCNTSPPLNPGPKNCPVVLQCPKCKPPELMCDREWCDTWHEAQKIAARKRRSKKKTPEGLHIKIAKIKIAKIPSGNIGKTKRIQLTGRESEEGNENSGRTRRRMMTSKSRRGGNKNRNKCKKNNKKGCAKRQGNRKARSKKVKKENRKSSRPKKKRPKKKGRKAKARKRKGAEKKGKGKKNKKGRSGRGMNKKIKKKKKGGKGSGEEKGKWWQK